MSKSEKWADRSLNAKPKGQILSLCYGLVNSGMPIKQPIGASAAGLTEAEIQGKCQSWKNRAISISSAKIYKALTVNEITQRTKSR